MFSRLLLLLLKFSKLLLINPSCFLEVICIFGQNSNLYGLYGFVIPSITRWQTFFIYLFKIRNGGHQNKSSRSYIWGKVSKSNDNKTKK